MNKPPANAPEHDEFFAELVVRHLAGDLDDAGREQLNALLEKYPEKRRAFVEICFRARLIAAKVGVEFAGEAEKEFSEVMPDITPPSMPPIVQTSPQIGEKLVWNIDLPGEKPRPKVVIETSPPRPIPWYSVNSPIGLRLIAHSISAILLLIGLGIASVVYVNHNYEIAGQAATSEEDSGGGGGGGFSGALATAEKAKAKKEETPFVGHISGMVDCRWADPALKPIAPPIRQGTKFALESGLMEITYTTGAKVILQGPCTYEVESPSGGYLALGKLTAKVASGQGLATSAKSQANLKSAISKSPNLQISKFTVRTPTALIIDLGTEFGVEVDESGATASYVFNGMVKIATLGNESQVKENELILRASQSARAERDEGGVRLRLLTDSEEKLAAQFVRRMPKALPAVPLAGLALWLDLSPRQMILDGREVRWVVDRGPEGRRLYTHYIEARPQYDAAAFGRDLPGLRFTNTGKRGLSNLQLMAVEGEPEPLNLTDRFHFFAVAKVTGQKQTILSSNMQGPGPGAIAWGVGFRGPGTLDFHDNHNWLGSEPNRVASDGDTAQILETRFERGRYEFFVNGVSAGTAQGAASIEVLAPFYFGIHGMMGDDPLVGALGEVLIYRTALSNDDRNVVGAYLQTKFGLSGEYRPTDKGG